jgi:hypothetical protein
MRYVEMLLCLNDNDRILGTYTEALTSAHVQIYVDV